MLHTMAMLLYLITLSQTACRVAAKKVKVMITIARLVLQSALVTHRGALARNVWPCHAQLSVPAAVNYQR